MSRLLSLVSPFGDMPAISPYGDSPLLSPFDDICMMSPFDDTVSYPGSTMKVTTAQEIGLAIRQRRQELGLSQQALADRVDVGRQWIVEIEQGKPRAEIGLLLRTLDVLALHVNIAPEGTSRETKGKHPLPDAQRKREVDINAIIERARKPWT